MIFDTHDTLERALILSKFVKLTRKTCSFQAAATIKTTPFLARSVV